MRLRTPRHCCTDPLRPVLLAGNAATALEMVHTLAEDFAAEVATLCATPVNHYQWQAFLERHTLRRDPRSGQMLEGRSLSMADRKRGKLELLYRADARVAPWTGTAHGVLQAVNTYEHHEGTVRGDHAERNNLKTITGDFGHLDRRTWRTLQPLLTA